MHFNSIKNVSMTNPFVEGAAKVQGRAVWPSFSMVEGGRNRSNNVDGATTTG